MSLAVKLVKEPLVHFLVAGGLLFVAYSWIHRGEENQNPRRIEITENQVKQIELDWWARWQRPPTPEELHAGIEEQLRQEILYREALQLGLDKNDTIVKRRLAQKMDFLAEEVAALREPAPGELQTWFKKNEALYVPPTLISFRHIYFSPDKRGSNTQRDAQRFLVGLGQRDTSGGDRFMFQSSYSEQSRDQLARVFGSKFAEQVFKLEPGGWRGPVESGLGWHLVWVESILPGQVPEFDAVSEQVKADWLAEQRSEMKRIEFEALKARYQIIIAPARVDSAQDLQLAVQQPVPME
jgi:hypothetical protein